MILFCAQGRFLKLKPSHNALHICTLCTDIYQGLKIFANSCDVLVNNISHSNYVKLVKSDQWNWSPGPEVFHLLWHFRFRVNTDPWYFEMCRRLWCGNHHGRCTHKNKDDCRWGKRLLQLGFILECVIVQCKTLGSEDTMGQLPIHF